MNSPGELLESLRTDERTSRAIDKAFEQAWLDIRDDYLRAQDSERARWKLASALLAVAPYHGTDVAKLREQAVDRMRYREKST
jgi:hypothetical protein